MPRDGLGPSASHMVALVPTRKVPHIILELVKGVGRRFKQKGLLLSEDRVREYFERRSLDGDYHDFTDSSRDWYLSVLRHSTALNERLRNNRPLVLDLGCGRGGLTRWLLSNKTQVDYIGIDQDRIAIEECRKHFQSAAVFVRGDIRKLTENLSIQVDIIFAVNVFPYIKNPTEIMIQCKTLLKSKRSFLAVIEPHPSCYWENEFGGFRIELREPASIIRYAEQAGWSLHDHARLAVASCFGKPLVTIAHLLVFSPFDAQATSVSKI
jgi:SAM-dependent methyltransferase